MPAQPLTSLRLTPTERGCVFAVRVVPGARREQVLGEHGDALRIAVAAPPERGQANRAVELLLASVLGVPKDAVRVAAGAASRSKRVEVVGVTVEEARLRLAASCAG